ncbi:MAG: hypothetical protein CMH56_09285 [Myxococcales bacterium]|nr:hypothetical protein [Myxococcales bacterium]
MNRLLSALGLLSLVVACGGPVAEPIVHPCTVADFCIYDEAREESNCQSGYTWENPSDVNNYNCVAMADEACVPTTCVALNANCGTLPDGCEGQLTCGECPMGQTCGAGGANLCGAGECTPTTCEAQGAECGSISDGCGNTLSCGTCPAGETCGSASVANVCVADAAAATCGNGIIDAGEQCDGTVFANGYGSCPAGTSGTVTCGTDCNVNTASCTTTSTPSGPAELARWNGADYLYTAIDPRDGSLVVAKRNGEFYRQSDSATFSTQSNTLDASALPAGFSFATPYSKNQDNRLAVLPDGRLVFAAIDDGHQQLIVATETTLGGDWDVYTLASSTEAYFSLDLEMAANGDLFLLVGQTDSMADGAPTAQRDIYLYERPVNAAAWSQVSVDFSNTNKLNEGCSTISESSIDIRYSANMAVDTAGNPAVMYLECNTYYQAKFIYKTASGWNREDFEFSVGVELQYTGPNIQYDASSNSFVTLIPLSGGGFVRLDKNMNNTSAALSETEMDENYNSYNYIWEVFSFAVLPNGSFVVGGTDLYGKEVYLATWNSDWSDLESELIMEYDSGCYGVTCLYLTGLFELKTNASGQVFGWLKHHDDNDYYVVTVTP